MTDHNSFDAEFDAIPSATQERATLRVTAERTDKLGVVIGGSWRWVGKWRGWFDGADVR